MKARRYVAKAGQDVQMQDKANYKVRADGAYVRTDPKTLSKKERNKLKRSSRAENPR